MKQKKLLLSLAFALMSMAGHAADNLPNLHVEGKNLVDSEGKTVVLHGVMDTPNRYFNGNRCKYYLYTLKCGKRSDYTVVYYDNGRESGVFIRSQVLPLDYCTAEYMEGNRLGHDHFPGSLIRCGHTAL